MTLGCVWVVLGRVGSCLNPGRHVHLNLNEWSRHCCCLGNRHMSHLTTKSPAPPPPEPPPHTSMSPLISALLEPIIVSTLLELIIVSTLFKLIIGRTDHF